MCLSVCVFVCFVFVCVCVLWVCEFVGLCVCFCVCVCGCVFVLRVPLTGSHKETKNVGWVCFDTYAPVEKATRKNLSQEEHTPQGV